MMMSNNSKTFLKIASLLLAAAVLIGGILAAAVSCGKDSSKNKDKDTSSQTQKTSPANSVNIIDFEDGDEPEEIDSRHAEDDETVTTTTTTATTKKKTTTTASATKETTKSATKAKTTTKATTTTAATKAEVKRDNNYTVSGKTYTSDDGKIKCTYPQIEGLYDETMQEFYNKLFRSDCKAMIGDNSYESFTETYEVKLKTKDKLSIVFRYGIYYKDGAHPFSTAYAYTIDLATGNTIIPSESVNMNKAADAILNDSWTLTRSSEGVKKSHVIDYFSQFNEEAMKSNISVENVIRVKSTDGKYTVTGKTYCNSYLDGNGEPVLILEVSHALGDYVEVQF